MDLTYFNEVTRNRVNRKKNKAQKSQNVLKMRKID